MPGPKRVGRAQQRSASDPLLSAVVAEGPGPKAAIEDAPAAVESAAHDTMDVARATVVDAAADLETTTEAVADQAETANREGAKAAETFAGSTAEAFGEARERLNAVSGALPSAAQDLLRPFTAASTGAQASYTSAIEGMAEFNSKAIAAWRSNAESTLRHWQNLAGVQSLSQAIALSAEHTRQQLEAVTAQTRELSSLATRIVRDATSSFKKTDP